MAPRRALGVRLLRAQRAAGGARLAGEKDAKSAQKLGQLQPFGAVFPQECIWANLHLLGRPDTLLALATSAGERRPRAPDARAWHGLVGAPLEGGGQLAAHLVERAAEEDLADDAAALAADGDDDEIITMRS